MIKIECDRCGKQERTALPSMSHLSDLPAGWQRLSLPKPDEAKKTVRQELCPSCLGLLATWLKPFSEMPQEAEKPRCTCNVKPAGRAS